VILVAAAALLFVVLKLYSLDVVVVGDEHLYFNMAVLVNKGLVPHRDFFYTHPPLHLYLAVLVFKLFGYSLALGKALPNAATLIGGLMLFAVGRRMLGAAEAAVACAIFLLSFDPLRLSSPAATRPSRLRWSACGWRIATVRGWLGSRSGWERWSRSTLRRRLPPWR
jgi:4-amino-4-deoxy-L-arabinose transferase-like glycosyltransferase